MLTAYLAGLLIAFVYTGPTWTAYVLAFGLAVAGRCLWLSPWAALGVLAPLTLLSQVALTISLSQYPWEKRLRSIRAATAFAYDKREPSRRLSNDWPPEVDLADILRLWPRNVLDPSRRERLLDRHDFVLISLLAGLVVYSARAGVPLNADTRKVLIALTTAVGLTTAIVRLGTYMGTRLPPISVWGRFATGQWFIPAYDIVFVAPLACVAAAVGTCFLASSLNASFAVSLGCVCSSTLLVAFLGGPIKRRWQLTCPCRLTTAHARSWTAEQI